MDNRNVGTQLAQVFILMCFVVNNSVTAQSDGGFLITWLCTKRWFSWLDIICSRFIPPTTISPTFSPLPAPTKSPIVLLPCDGGCCIKTSADLQAAFENAPTHRTSPSTVVKVCEERIVVPPLFKITTPTSSNDAFGFQINYKNIDLQCGRTSPTAVRGLCTLEGTGGAGLFYLNNSTLKVTGFTLANGGSKDHSAGGAIYKTNYSFVTLVDSLVKDNVAQNGGAVYNNNTADSESLLAQSDISGRIELLNTAFIGNKAKNGGAIYASNTFINGNNVEFQQNEGSRVGGALGFYGKSSVFFNNSLITNNYAGGYGGAVFTGGNADAKFYNTQFLQNKALGSVVEIFGQSRIEIEFSEVKDSLVNETRSTLFDVRNEDLKEFGVLKNASAIRSLSSNGVSFQKSLFSNNKVALDYTPPEKPVEVSISRSSFNRNGSVEPYDTANLFVGGNGTAECSAVTYCGDVGVACVGSTCTNCNQPGSSSDVVQPGDGVCYDKVTQCFQSTDELRLAVTSYFGNASDIVKKQYGDPIGTWCVDNIFDFSYLFSGNDFGSGIYFNEGARSFNEDISGWNTSSATNMVLMFANSSFNRDISSWDVSKVTDMTGMFLETPFNQKLNAWNVSNVRLVGQMFYGAKSFNGSLNNWDVSAVTVMAGMFYNASKFNGELEDWDVASVTDMGFMFSFAESFAGTLKNWDVSSVTNMRAMFQLCKKFNGDLEGWDVSSVTDMSFMFYGAESFTGTLTNWDVSAVTAMFAMFYDAFKFNGNLEAWQVSSVTTMKAMFSGAISFTGSLSNWDVSSVTDMALMFQYTKLFNGDLENWDVSSVTDMAFMFAFTESFTGSLQNWDVSSVIGMWSMFQGSKFNGDVENWNVSSVVGMSNMFYDADLFDKDLSTWDVSSVQYLSGMFAYADRFSQNLCPWGMLLSGQADVNEMFIVAISCPTTANPVLSQSIPGPFCYECL